MLICITGGRGFLGSAVTQALQAYDVDVRAFGRADGDISNQSIAERLLKDADVVIHLAADVGGVGYLRQRAGAAFHDNFRLGLNVVRAACTGKATRVVMAGTPCSYSGDCPLPLREDSLTVGVPSGDTGNYGYAKLASSLVANHFCIPEGIDTVTVIPSNLYGPGDNYDSERGHVVAALIRKALIAEALGQNTFGVWGDGAATRDFIYVEDVADAIARIALSNKPHAGETFNLGSGVETSIRQVAHAVASAISDRMKPVFDSDKPVGYNRRVMSIERAEFFAAYRPTTSLNEGLAKTVACLRRDGAVESWLQTERSKAA